MPDNNPNIPIPIGEWVDLYDLTGITVGEPLHIKNLGVSDIRLAVQAAKPDNDHGAYDVIEKNDDIAVTNNSGDSGAWAISPATKGLLSVASTANEGFWPALKTLLADGFGNPIESLRNAINVNTQLNTTAFGDLKAEEMTPVTQISAEYGLLNQVLTVVDAGASGSVSVVDNKFTSQSGTAADGVAAILSFRLLTYRPGQGAIARFTALFTTGVALSRQLAGLITAENSFAFGYVGVDFGIIHTHDGESEYRELTITTPAAGAENATITVDGIGYTVPLTAGTVQHNAFEIANSLTAQVPNYDFSSNNDQVLAQAVLNGPSGSFAFSSATAVAAWVQITLGVLPETDFTPQSAWSEDNFSGVTPTFDPTLGNVYQIQFQYLGFGAIKFYVEDPATGDFVLVHIIKFANTSTIPSVTNPSFRIGWVARNFGNTTNLTVAGSSAAGFIEGKSTIGTAPRADEHDQAGVDTTPTNIITFRNRLNFSGKRNRAEILPLLLSLSTQANKSAFFEVFANPDFGGDLNFNYIDKTNSLMESAKDSVSVSGGQRIAGITVVAGSSEKIEFNIRDWHKFVASPGQIFTVAAHVSSGAAGDMQASATWVEDI